MFVLTDPEIEALTGLKTVGAQTEWLHRQEYPYRTRLDGSIVIVRTDAGKATVKSSILPTHHYLSREEILDRGRLARLRCGVYFLLKDDEIVYVGATTSFGSRLSQHLMAKIIDFDYYTFLPVEYGKLVIVEAEYIARLKPKYNKR